MSPTEKGSVKNLSLLLSDLFNAELCPKRHWQGPGSQEIGWGWEVVTIPNAHCHHHNDSCLKNGRNGSFHVLFAVGGKATRQWMPINQNL